VPALVQLDPRTINQSGALFFAGGAAWELAEGTHAANIRRAALDLLASDVADYTPASSDLTAARAAALLGDRSDARACFARARTALEARGQRALRAIVDYDEALVLRREEPRAAAGLLEGARGEFVALEMTGWLERTDALLSSLRGAYPSGLTSREAEVLRLLSGGGTNREIAAELVISVHTVERHVANIYRKIGAKNRADATMFAHTNGLAAT
jgi:DNA-binding NarL/FixJ family response regulator